MDDPHEQPPQLSDTQVCLQGLVLRPVDCRAINMKIFLIVPTTKIGQKCLPAEHHLG